MKRLITALASLVLTTACGARPAEPSLINPAFWAGTVQYMQQVLGPSSATITWTGFVSWDSFKGTEVYYVRPGLVKVTYAGSIASFDTCVANGDLTPPVLSTPGAGGVGVGSTNFLTVQKDGSYDGRLTVDATIDVVTTCTGKVDFPPTHDPTFVEMDLKFSGKMDISAPQMRGQITPITFGNTVYTGAWDFAPLRLSQMVRPPVFPLAGLAARSVGAGLTRARITQPMN